MLTLILLCLISTSYSANNFLPNPSFEEGSGTTITGWSIYGGQCELTTATAHTGKQSVHCKDTKTDSATGIITYTSNLIPGIYYNISVYIKMSNVQNGYLLMFAESMNYIYGVYLNSNSNEVCKTGTCNDKWYQFTAPSEMSFQQQRYTIQVNLRPDKGIGEYWIDDFTLIPVEKDVLVAIDPITWRQEAYEDPFEIRVGLNTIRTTLKTAPIWT
ncbi:hypothetical protein EIN_024980 [Entamoeba invadens IP1]|uniref:hypothetical protein n=1 Tax=Entamoeba invadens IP1 TaxID=370355 RepID=UPI0002C3FB19|nr:hypothetical protein EIN_024980 [Entamoeba invadens IP1]ELP90709.1 hypothetical protein EIN_024980 [Entamoeba invadens IP1]|eukprot:XP_004257480.1 hypothetical protein EIN_024980 [Entamoeba invadens IP1]